MTWWQTLLLVLFLGPSIVWLSARAGVISAQRRLEREQVVRGEAADEVEQEVDEWKPTEADYAQAKIDFDESFIQGICDNCDAQFIAPRTDHVHRCAFCNHSMSLTASER